MVLTAVPVAGLVVAPVGGHAGSGVVGPAVLAAGREHPDTSSGSGGAPAATRGLGARSPLRPEVGAAAVVRAWDAARAAAWSAGDATALRRLYAPGSAAGRADVVMLRAWRARGLRLRGLTTQLLAVEVVRRLRDGWVLRVTDRVVGGTVERDTLVGGTRRERLHPGAPATRQVLLVRSRGRWQVASVHAG